MKYVTAVLLAVAMPVTPVALQAELPARQMDRIRKAVPDKPRVPPRKPRTVLIWNTPAAFMDKDQYRGYCIPYGEAAMQLLGEKTAAFKPGWAAVLEEDHEQQRGEKVLA